MRDEASTAGDKIHVDINLFLNNYQVDNPDTDFKYFKEWFDYMGKELDPYRTEWKVYDKFLKMAGSIDLVSKNRDGTYDLWDWKRTKAVKHYSRRYGETLA